MPTIEELDAAVAVADTDALPISQNGQVHKATRAQMLAGLQPQLALAAGQLLGRHSAGSGGPEPIALGSNLSLSAGTLQASTPSFSDISGVAAGSTASRSLADALGDAVPVEAFGAKGDGETDDTLAFAVAVASGKPLRLGPNTYIVNGQWVISQPGTTILGVPGASVLRRKQQVGNGAWIAVQADRFRADGVTFDANRATVLQESWGVLVTSLCQISNFYRCAFLNASGSTLGSGLVIQASDPALCQHVMRDCEFNGNAAHGLWVQACAGVQVVDCRAHANGLYGINVDYNDTSFQQQAHLVQLVGNRCWGNVRGIAVGNYNATNTQPAVWGNAHPDARSVLISGNICHDNAVYGLAVSGSALLVQGNLLSNNGTLANSGAGLLANASYSRLAGNMIVGNALYAIDCGGSIGCEVSGNYISGGSIGINCGGGLNMRVADNSLQDCTGWAVIAENVETDGQGNNFGIPSSNLAVTGNWIALFSSTAGGVLLRDGAQHVLVARNDFVGDGDVANCLWANTDSVITEGNRFNFTARFICNPSLNGGLQQIVYPDIADSIMVTWAPSGVQAMVSSYQARSVGTISFIRITNGGSGYTHASLSLQGAGSGAAAAPVISGGVLIGAVVTSPGSGYGQIGTTVAVTISGDGAGATALAYAGAPLPEERRLLVRCNATTAFARNGSVPLQENWTQADISIPADAEVEWTATWGMWRAGRYVPFHT